MSHAVSIELGDSLTMDSHPRLIDSLPPHPNPLKMSILVLGMPRTGVSSIRAALSILSYNCFDTATLNTTPSLYPYWTEALSGYHYGTCAPYGRVEYDKLLGDYDVSCNLPGTFVWKDLVDAYPDAKIILTTRDVEGWVESMRKSVDQDTTSASTWSSWDVVTRFAPAQRAWWKYQKFLHRLRMHICPKGERQAYLEHYEAVRQYVPRDRLLEFDVKEGWEPLCEFLGKEVPERGFPFVNDKDGWKVARTQRWYKSYYAMVSTVLPPLGVVLGGAVGWWVAKM